MKTENLHKHVCKITGKGMSEGFLMNHETYKEEKDFVEVLREEISNFNADINSIEEMSYNGLDALGGGLIPKTITDADLLEYSYDNGYHIWTSWEDQEDLEEEGKGYDDEGNLYEFKPLNKEWIRVFELSDYDIIGGDGVTEELWEHKITKKLVVIPIEIVRDFDNIEWK